MFKGVYHKGFNRTLFGSNIRWLKSKTNQVRFSSSSISSLILHNDLNKQLEKVRKTRNFQVDKWIDQKTDLLNDYMRKCNLKGCVISVSGGIDSSVSLALAIKASEKEKSPIKKVLGIAQPIYSTEKIWKRAFVLKEAYGVEIVTADQSEIFDSLKKVVDGAVGVEGKDFASGQLKSYMRTPVGYYATQLLSQQGIPSIVLGTGNMDEDGYLFYFCKAGDGVVDVQLIADLHKSEVYKVADALKVPDTILKAKPSADLWQGQSDEEELGFSYDFVELWTSYLKLSEEDKLKMKNECSNEAWTQFNMLSEMAKGVHDRNKHKGESPVNLNIL